MRTACVSVRIKDQNDEDGIHSVRKMKEDSTHSVIKMKIPICTQWLYSLCHSHHNFLDQPYQAEKYISITIAISYFVYDGLAGLFHF